MSGKRVLIVGAGVGGLASAIRLAGSGLEVEVFEKNLRSGGRMGRLEGGGFVFDTGPSLLLMTDVYRDLFRSVGESLEDYVELLPLDSRYRVVFGDGDSITMRRTLPEMIRELERIEPGVTPRFYRFLETSCHRYRLGRSEFVERDFESAGEFFSTRNLRLLAKTGALGNYYRSVSRFFRTEKLRQAFSLQTMYLGLSPFEAPAVYSLLPYTEIAEDGLWFPRGGMYELVRAMETLARELGVDFHLGCPVEEILVRKGRAVGVRAGGEGIHADAVLANADLPYVYRELLGGRADGDFGMPRRSRQKLRYTASAFMLYLGVGRKLDHMLHHNFYLSGRYRENFEQIFEEGVLPDDPSFYAVVPSRTEPAMAPEGMESLFVLVPVPHLGGRVDWEREGEAFRGKVYSLLEERCGIHWSDVLFEEVRTPRDWREEYNLEMGAAFGLGHGILQVGYFRPPIASKGTKGLYFVGASTHPGTGVPLVVIGARLASEKILEDLS
ncbi:phytoene desaturase family protein [Rubrobacter calidifluminis]|uniref:phytoene desaturase family protein n=1 Tax=Rubrobacter calidifluminis TaxID=1392640 RepID=UPI00235E0A51|nr:phytoene desaturase family protein [Rubrobacter calidifluminis]